MGGEGMNRNVVWFSCGSASAVTAYLAVKEGLNPIVVYCDTMSDEHPDNQRFFNDVQQWIGVEILKIKSTKYENVDAVFEGERYMSGIRGAFCTSYLKKFVRQEFQQKADLFNDSEDYHFFGFTVDEHRRITNFKNNNPEIQSRFILPYFGLTKADCHERIKRAGIEIPMMYKLGFNNNNCLGCVKAQSPKYWNLIRKNFPDTFTKRCEQSRKLNVRLVKIGKQRIFLDELQSDNMTDNNEQIECGVVCQSNPTSPIRGEGK